MSQSSPATLLQRRRETRQLNDPHHVHPLRRTYIGPSPVGARSAAAVAALIAHDVEITNPFKVSVIDAQGRVQMASEEEYVDDYGRASIDSAPAAVAQQSEAQPTSHTPSKRPTELSPLHIPRSNNLLRWTSRSSSVADPSSSNALTASPRPLTPTRSQSARHFKSQSLVEDRQASGSVNNLPGVKFDLDKPRQRRQYSESSAYDHRSVSQRRNDIGQNSRAALPLLDVSVDEEGPNALKTPESSPQKANNQLSPNRALDVAAERGVRHASSFQSFGGRSNASTTRKISGVRKQPSASTITMRKKRSTDGSMIDRGFNFDGDQTTDTANLASDAPDTSRTEWTGNALSDSDTLERQRQRASRLEVIRERARRRYRTSKIGQAGESSLQANGEDNQIGPNLYRRRQHGREASRQSRFSYVSAAGTHTSVGTRFTEGSFGAHGGFRAKIVRSFGFQKKDRTPTTQSVRAEARRRGRHSSSSRGGVIPGAVGTSAGGTKWIGQSFEIGKRFWEALANREEYICSTHDDLLAVVREEDLNEGQQPKKTHTDSDVVLHSPDDVLNKFAHEASQSQDDGKNRATNSPSVQALAPLPPVDKRADMAKPNGSAKLRLKEDADDAAPSERALTRYQSAASLLTIPQDRELQGKGDIENRTGWSDVVSFITAQTQLPATVHRNARSASDNLSEMGGKAKRAFDGHLTDIRNRNAAKEQRRNADQRSDEPPLPRLSQGDLLQKPVAPLEQKVDGDLAEATFELTRRPSWPGVPADGQLNDAASDHEVAARPTMKSAERTELAREQLQIPRSALSPTTRALRQKKSVQFGRDLPKRSMTVEDVTAMDLTQDGSPGEESKLQILAGRLRPAVRSGDAAPAPPEEVLSRQPSPGQLAVADKKTAKYLAKETPSLKEALKRDRMLVKVAWTSSEDVPKEFTERLSRKYEMHAEPFREYMVVFRAGRLELWDDPSWTSRAIGHGDRLHLRYVAPLRRGRAFISLFSPIDSIFCLSFIADHHRSLFNLRRSGTHLWLFDARAASNSADWMWELWRELGGQIPEAIDVHIPVMGTRVRVPIPDEIVQLQARQTTVRSISRSTMHSRKANTEDSEETLLGEGYKIITLKNVVDIVSELLRTFTKWYELSLALQRAGMQFGLAWRTNLRLNWVQHSTTIEGQRRDWAVLVGDLLSDTKEHSVLEFRGKAHYPHMTKTVKGKELLEPSAIEGFIWRVKAVSGNLTRLYVSTHDGLLFINRPSRAYPPDRYVATDVLQTHSLRRSNGSMANNSINERRTRSRRNSKSSGNRANSNNDESWTAMGRRVAELTTLVPNELGELDAQIEAFRGLERRRQFEQINASDGYVDVRDIFLIRSLDTDRGLTRKPGSEEDDIVVRQGCSDDTDHHDTPPEEEDDVGGEEGYEMAKDRAALKRARQFEVMLINGRSVRFEAYSRSVAREWIMRLGDLARYWKRREKDDALSLMNASGFDERLYKRKAQSHHDLRPFDKVADSDRLSPLLGRIWNWCVLDGCRNILRAGRLFTKKKPYTAFGSRYCILISGRILTYKLMTSNRTARARQNAGIFHKRQETVIHLRDSYVYSGKLSDHMLVNGRSDGAGAIGNFGGGSGGAATSTSRHTLPRVYADGMLSIDDDEECTFVIRYRPQRVNRSANPQVNVPDADALSTKDGETTAGGQGVGTKPVSVTTLRDSVVNVIAMRARSKLERDLWVWAINTERERLVRDDPLREDRLRQNGKTPFKAH